MAKRKSEGEMSENEMNASQRGEDTDSTRFETTSWGTVTPGAEEGGAQARTGRSATGGQTAGQTNNQAPRGQASDLLGGAADMLVNKAQNAIENGLQKLDPEVVQWGQSILASMAVAAVPVRRSFKTQPLLTGMGVGAIGLGAIMLAVAISKDRQAQTATPARRQPVREN